MAYEDKYPLSGRAAERPRGSAVSDKIIPFRRKDQVPVPTESLAAALAQLPEEAPVLIQFVVKQPPTP